MSARRRQRVRFFVAETWEISPKERLARKAEAALGRPIYMPMTPWKRHNEDLPYDDAMNHVVRHGLACT